MLESNMNGNNNKDHYGVSHLPGFSDNHCEAL